ncbi:MAG: DUF3793 family protein [Eubacteriales bacterium]
MSYELIVQYCSPTLAGLKIGSLFSYAAESEEALQSLVQARNAALNPKGIYFTVLRHRNGRALIYVYRKNQLENVLKNPEIRAFLRSMGYHSFTWQDCRSMLMHHLSRQDFPHEIGIFLGYPLADIKGFIQHKGANYKLVGCWKVYSDEKQAKSLFDSYSKCTRIYETQLAHGTDITQLTVAV